MEFDFRDAVHRVVKAGGGQFPRMRAEKSKSTARKDSQNTSGKAKATAFSAAPGFNMPKMTGRKS